MIWKYFSNLLSRKEKKNPLGNVTLFPFRAVILRSQTCIHSNSIAVFFCYHLSLFSAFIMTMFWNTLPFYVENFSFKKVIEAKSWQTWVRCFNKKPCTRRLCKFNYHTVRKISQCTRTSDWVIPWQSVCLCIGSKFHVTSSQDIQNSWIFYIKTLYHHHPLQDGSDHCYSQLPVLCSFKQCLTLYHNFLSPLYHPFSQTH